MFEKASRLKLRFDTPKGSLSVEDLWDLPLVIHKGGTAAAGLDNLARNLNKQIKEASDDSFVTKTSAVSTVLQLKFDLVKHVIDVRLAEAALAEDAAEKRQKKQKLLEILSRKKDAELEGSSIEDLEKAIAAL